MDEVQQVFIHMGVFSSRLREERKRLGLSQEALAELGGVKLNAQSNYETGKRAPDADYLARVAVHGVDVAFLFSGQRTPVARDASANDEQSPSTASGDIVMRAVTREEAALLDNYEAADERGRAAARSVLDALAQPQPKRANG
ncbi:helix-turn-helix domain-containing protein [Variovorax paradoxus]|uniref:helix-turn-helix domain-containing protein n=1 Tax=Variovorax paradoxus TaxID=34073 RepID=UPI003ECC311C